MPKRTPVLSIHDSDGTVYAFKLLTASTARVALRPYYAEVGRLANAWNHLHHNLSSLFSVLLRCPNAYVGQSLWHALESDFLQRKMLASLLAADRMEGLPSIYQPLITQAQADDILYVLNEIEKPLRHHRNNAIHAPLILMSGIHLDAMRSWAEAHFNTQNPRAKPLLGKDLIEEFRRCTIELERLSAYANEMWLAVNPFYHERHPWPERPPSPQAHNTKRTSRRGKSRLPAHRLKA
jgi:hypothetical protein